MCNVNKGHSGRRSAHSVEHVDAVRESVLWSPRKSTRRLSAETSIPRSSVHRIQIADLHLFPFKIQSQSKLTAHQQAKKLEFAQWFSGRLGTNDTFLRKHHMTDEYHAHLSGKVNKQNFRYWGTENPSNEIVDESPRSELKVIVWVAIGWYWYHWALLF